MLRDASDTVATPLVNRKSSVRLPFYTAQTILPTQESHRDSSHRAVCRAVKYKRRVTYYVPAVEWLPKYTLDLFGADFVAGLTVACILIPVSLSYSANLAKVPPIYGLYAALIGPAIYAILGSCKEMAVGPEAAVSLLIGESIRNQLRAKHSVHDSVLITGIITFLAGLFVLTAGILRLGFLDSVLSRPLLRGFISAVAVVIAFDQAIIALGLTQLAETTGISHFAPIQKAIFVICNLYRTHKVTACLSFGSIVLLLSTRVVKKSLSRKFKWAVGIPDILIVVICTSFLTFWCDWESQGVAILGQIETKPVSPHLPFTPKHGFEYVGPSLSTALLCAILGFFECCVAGKALGNQFGYSVSPNREMIAFGVANIAGSFFGALPVFASYSRSRINISAGGRTQMSSIITSGCVAAAMLYLLPLFYYLPKGVLSSIIAVIMVGLLKEAPHDIAFFWKVEGYQDLLLMLIVFLCTLFVSLEFGISIGVGVSLLRVIKHSQSPRIIILGRHASTNEFVPVSELPEEVEHVDGVLIVGIPEPLIFANAGQLRDRLRRLELYGDTRIHPSEPPTRLAEHNARIVFDLDGMSSIDSSALQILYEIVHDYVSAGTEIYFVKLLKHKNDIWSHFVRSGLVDIVGGESHFKGTIDDALAVSAEGV